MKTLLILIVLLMSSSSIIAQNSIISNEFLKEDSSINYDVVPQMEMFDPENAKAAEEIIENLFSDKTRSVAESNQLITNIASTSPHHQEIFNEVNTTEAHEAQKTLFVMEYEAAAAKSARATELKKQAAQAYAAGKEDEESLLDREADYTQSSAKTMMKAIEARIVRKRTLAVEYDKVAAKSDEAAELIKQATQVYVAGKKDEGRVWVKAGDYTQSSAETMMKAIEARESEKIVLAAEYERVVTKSDQAVDLIKQAAQAYAAVKEHEGFLLMEAGDCIQSSAETMMKAIEVHKAGSTYLVAGYEKAVVKLDQAAELMKQAAQAHAAGKEEEARQLFTNGERTQELAEATIKETNRRAPGKSRCPSFHRRRQKLFAKVREEEKAASDSLDKVTPNDFKYKALRIYCKHWLENVGVSERQPSYADKALESGTIPQLVAAFNTCCDHVKVSLDSGGFLALSWIQIAEDLQNVIEESTKGSHSTGGISLLDHLKASSHSSVPVQQVTAGVQNTIEDSTQSSDSSRQVSLRDRLKASRCSAVPVQQVTVGVQNAIEDSTQSSDSPKSNRLLELLSAIQDSMKITPLIKSPSLLDKLKASRKDESSARSIRDTLQLVKYKVELIQSLVFHQRPEIVNAWEKIVKQSQRFENYRSDKTYILEANKIIPQFREECKDLLEKTVYSLKKATRLLSKLAYADEVQGVDGAQKLSVQELLDASSTGATKQFAAEVAFRKKSTRADQENKQSLTTLWLNLTHGNQLFLEYRQNRENFNPLKGEQLHLDNERVHCLESTQSMLEKAMIADQRGRQEEVALYEKAASQYQAAAENCRKTTENYLGMQELGCSFLAASKAAQSNADELKLAAETPEKACEGENSVNPSVESDRGSIDNQNSSNCFCSNNTQLLSSIFHLPSPTAAAVSPASSLQPIASLWPVGRIVNNDLKNKALGIYCEHWLAGIGATTEGSAYANKALERGVDPQLVEAFNKCCDNVSVSLESGGLLALSWIQVAEDLQNAIEDNIRGVHRTIPTSLQDRLKASRNGTLRFGKSISPMQQLVKYKVELIRSSVLRQRPEIMKAWEKIVRQSQHLVEKYRRAEVLEANKDRSWFNSDHCKEYEGLLEKAACSLRKGTIADQEGKQSLASLWLNLIRENQLLLEHFQNRDNLKTLDFFISETRHPDKVIVKNLESTQSMLEKAMIADQRGRQEEVTLYEQAASQYQEAAENFRAAAEAYLIMKESARGFLAASEFSKSSANGLQLAAEALEKAFLWQKKAEQYQVAAMYERQAAEAYIQGNTENGDRFHEEASKVWTVVKKTEHK